jgi:RimJ/RimL family protein N-acetyltransferase
MNYWQGKSVRLRSIEPDDGPFLFELSKDTDTRVGLSATIDLPRSLASCVKWAEEASKEPPKPESCTLVIERKGSPMGTICPHHPDAKAGVFRYGIQILPGHRRNGYAREAVLLVLRYFFDFLRYQKCSIGVYSFNTISARFHESLGFTQEGCTRRAAYVAGRFYDCFAYGMTAEEFRAKHGEFPSLAIPTKRSALK